MSSWSAFLDTSASSIPRSSSHSSNPSHSFGAMASSRARAIQQHQMQSAGSASQASPRSALQLAVRHPKRGRDEVDEGCEVTGAEWDSQGGGGEEQSQLITPPVGVGFLATPPLHRYSSGEKDRSTDPSAAAAAVAGSVNSCSSTPMRRSSAKPAGHAHKRQHLQVDPTLPLASAGAHAHSAASSPFIRTQQQHLPLSFALQQSPQHCSGGFGPASLPCSLTASPSLAPMGGLLAPPHTPSLPPLLVSTAGSSPMHAHGGSMFTGFEAAVVQQHQMQQQQQHALHMFALHSQTTVQSPKHSSAQMSPHTPQLGAMSISTPPTLQAFSFPKSQASATGLVAPVPLSARPLQAVTVSYKQGTSVSLSSMDDQDTSSSSSSGAGGDPLSSSPVSPHAGYEQQQHYQSPSLSSISANGSMPRLLRTYSSNGSVSVQPAHLCSVPSSLQSSHPPSPSPTNNGGRIDGAAVRASAHGTRGRSFSAATAPSPSFLLSFRTSCYSPSSPFVQHAAAAAAAASATATTSTPSAAPQQQQQVYSPFIPPPIVLPTPSYPAASSLLQQQQQTANLSPRSRAHTPTSSPMFPDDLIGNGSMEVGVGVLYVCDDCSERNNSRQAAAEVNPLAFAMSPHLCALCCPFCLVSALCCLFLGI